MARPTGSLTSLWLGTYTYVTATLFNKRSRPNARTQPRELATVDPAQADSFPAAHAGRAGEGEALDEVAS